MVWYNPLTWLGNNTYPDISDDLLKCDSPPCAVSLMDSSEVAYDKKTGEIYHPEGSCIQFATAHRAMNSSTVAVTNVDYISIDKAIKLFNKGKLAQSQNIAEVVSE